MSKYRKIYNDNLLGTTFVSNFKFYYASFKIQQQNGKVTDITLFLDSCAQIAIRTSRELKILGLIPCIHLLFGTGHEQKQIAEVISKKRKEVEKLFLQDDVSEDEINKLLYDFTDRINANTPRNTEGKLKLSIEYILKCYSIKGKKQLGDRIFGYLLKAKLIEANDPRERLDVWHNFIGKEINPSDVKLLATPELSRTNSLEKDLTLIKHLENIHQFFNEIGLPNVANIVEKDIKEEKSKTK
ncbi:MAG: hypothetical protein JZU53_00405 [Paludibacter sp.]|nr:hypothetical protein [Paludibacter sp.]